MDVSPRTVEHQMAHALQSIRAHLAPFMDESVARAEKNRADE
jgi:hypothetical protein